MKTLKILILILALGLTGLSSPGQGMITTYSGLVLNAANDDPVPFHPVDIYANGQIYLKTLYTDETGLFRDSLFFGGDSLLTSLRFATFDCQQQVIDTTVTALNQLIFVILRICVDTIPVPCQADFEAVLDSNLNILHQFHFYDLSTGSIDSWLWNFGDGSISLDQNPVHQYQQEGTYQVCLTVTDNSNPAGCTDMKCQLISTPEYYNFGGMTYLGDSPMNNPMNQGDTGIAYLFRVFEQQLLPVDMKSFVDYGYYWFTGMLEGDYVVKVSLSPGSTHYQDYFPAYSGGSLTWEDASVFELIDSTIFDADIHLGPVPFTLAGTGVISGYLAYPWNNPALPAFQVEPVVLLFDDAGNPLKFCHPALDGSFSFTGLPAGTYILKADLTGFLVQSMIISLAPGEMIVQGIELLVLSEGTFGIHDPENPGFSLGRLYPNPAREVLHLEISSHMNSGVEFVAIDLLGKAYILKSQRIQTGRQEISLPVADLPQGVFLLGIRQGNGTITGAGKFIH